MVVVVNGGMYFAQTHITRTAIISTARAADDDGGENEHTTSNLTFTSTYTST